MISIILPTWNRPDLLLDRAIPSIVAQTYPDWELLIIGDGCAPEVAAKIADGLSDSRISFTNIPRQNYPESPEARWRCTAVDASNWGMDHAKGEWLTGMADDDELPPDALERLLAGSEGANVVYGRAEVVGHGILGSWPPREGHIQSAMWRPTPERLRVCDYPSDWEFLSRLTNFAFVPDIVYRYHPGSHVPPVEPLICAVIPTRFHPPELDRLLDVLRTDGVIPLVLNSADYDHRIYRMWNVGVARAKAEHPGCTVAVLNDDIEILPGTLPTLARALAAHPELGVIYPEWSFADPSSMRVAEPTIEYTEGGHPQGGMTGFCFVFRDGPAFDEGYNWWYGDNAFEAAVRSSGRLIGRAVGVAVRHHLDGSASRVWEELQPLIAADRTRWDNRQ